MGGVLNQVIDGYNEYVDGQREFKSKSKCLFSLTKFDTRGVRNVCERTDIRFAPRLDRYNYVPGSSTNLYDAIGERLTRLLSEQDLLSNLDVVIVVYTDGYENASKNFKYDDVLTLIKRCESLGWTFVYMGSNQDAWEVGSKLGVTNHLNTMSFMPEATHASFTALNNATMGYRATRGLAASAVGQEYSFFDPNTNDIVKDNKTKQVTSP